MLTSCHSTHAQAGYHYPCAKHCRGQLQGREWAVDIAIPIGFRVHSVGRVEHGCHCSEGYWVPGTLASDLVSIGACQDTGYWLQQEGAYTERVTGFVNFIGLHPLRHGPSLRGS